jgi:hypothetical protein
MGVEEAWQRRVAEWLVASGCLYVIAWGIDCEKWHDCVDRAVIETHNYGEIPDDKFIMTTWHRDESLSEAFWYTEYCASHPDVELSETIIVHISVEARGAEMLRAYADSQVEADET